MKEKSHYYNNSDIGYCDPEWMEIKKPISKEIKKDLDLINKEILDELDIELAEDEKQA